MVIVGAREGGGERRTKGKREDEARDGGRERKRARERGEAGRERGKECGCSGRDSGSKNGRDIGIIRVELSSKKYYFPSKPERKSRHVRKEILREN